jgi:hypothetical protein
VTTTVPVGDFASELRRLPEDERDRLAKLARELLSSPLWATIADYAERRKITMLTGLAPPRMPDRATYAQAHGQISGLSEVVALPQLIIDIADSAADERKAQAELTRTRERGGAIASTGR